MPTSPSVIPNVDKKDLLDAVSHFDLHLRDTEEWVGWTSHLNHKYAIYHDGKVYPVKKIISLATGFPVSKFSGGSQANSYMIKRGFNVISLRAFSWSVLSGDVSAKVLDKSSFLHHGTGIPAEIRPFFLQKELDRGERFPIILVVHGDQEYKAHIDMEGQDTARTRLFWYADFTSLLQGTFPHHYQLYNQDQTPGSEIVMQFKRVSGFEKYEIKFTACIRAEIAAEDIDAEEIEDRGPKKEGKAKEYYGKRYERSPYNRQQAIKYHGLSCNVCGFNFEKIYGARGAEYIEVHHINPISSYEEEQVVDPKTDLITVCSNCHRMIHRKPDDVLTIAAMQALLNRETWI